MIRKTKNSQKKVIRWTLENLSRPYSFIILSLFTNWQKRNLNEIIWSHSRWQKNVRGKLFFLERGVSAIALFKSISHLFIISLIYVLFQNKGSFSEISRFIKLLKHLIMIVSFPMNYISVTISKMYNTVPLLFITLMKHSVILIQSHQWLKKRYFSF